MDNSTNVNLMNGSPVCLANVNLMNGSPVCLAEDIKNNEHLKEYKVYKPDGTIAFMAHRLPTSKDTQVSFVNGEIMKLPTYYGDWVISTAAEISAFNEIIRPTKKVKEQEEKPKDRASLEKEIAELEKYLNSKKAERDNLHKLAMESKI